MLTQVSACRLLCFSTSLSYLPRCDEMRWMRLKSFFLSGFFLSRSLLIHLYSWYFTIYSLSFFFSYLVWPNFWFFLIFHCQSLLFFSHSRHSHDESAENLCWRIHKQHLYALFYMHCRLLLPSFRHLTLRLSLLRHF